MCMFGGLVVPRRGNHKCGGLEVSLCLLCLKNSKETMEDGEVSEKK